MIEFIILLVISLWTAKILDKNTDVKCLKFLPLFLTRKMTILYSNSSDEKKLCCTYVFQNVGTSMYNEWEIDQVFAKCMEASPSSCC